MISKKDKNYINFLSFKKNIILSYSIIFFYFVF
jgi:hypothetical protein